jgi:hypothetical protein
VATNDTPATRGALVDALLEGCVYRPKRWSGDTHDDLGGSIDEDATNALMQEAADRINTLELEALGAGIKIDDLEREAAAALARTADGLVLVPACIHEATCRECAYLSQAKDDIRTLIDTAWPDAGREDANSSMDALMAAYQTWPADIRKKLSAHDLRRMNGWAPRTKAGDWCIDNSAGGPILVYQGCSVIEGEQARYVLSLIDNDGLTPAGGEDGARLDWLAREYWRLDPFDIPTGAVDADVGWRVLQYHGDAPRERTVAEVYTDDPRAAIDAAIAAERGAGEGRGDG